MTSHRRPAISAGPVLALAGVSLLLLGAGWVTLPDLLTIAPVSPSKPRLDAAGAYSTPAPDAVRVPHDTGPELISSSLPASAVYSNHQEIFPAERARDDAWSGYGSGWRSRAVPPTETDPYYLAYDVSSIPAISRQLVLSLWVNEQYNYDTAGGYSYGGLFGDYRVQANAAPGGMFPVNGWVDLVTVTDNTLISGEQLLQLAGYNWVRLRVTRQATTAEPQYHQGAGVTQWQLFDALGGGGVKSFKFIGDSITSNYMIHNDADAFDRLVLKFTGHRPAFEKASQGSWGIDGLLSPASPGPTIIDNYLANFPGRFVGVAIGTNDLNGDWSGARAESWYKRMTVVCDKILAAGKVPVIPRIIYSPLPSYGRPNADHYNGVVTRLWRTYSTRIVQGPDLFTDFFNDAAINGGPDRFWSGSDNLHPNAAGEAHARLLWAIAISAAVYGKNPP